MVLVHSTPVWNSAGTCWKAMPQADISRPLEAPGEAQSGAGDDAAQQCRAGLDVEQLVREFPGGALKAVGDDGGAGALQRPPDPCRAEGEDYVRAFARKSSAEGRAKEVWCEKLHTRPAPAPISTQSCGVKGAPLSSRSTAAAMDAGLYKVPKGLRSTLKPASERRAPISSAKQLPSTHTESVRAIVDNFSQLTSV